MFTFLKIYLLPLLLTLLFFAVFLAQYTLTSTINFQYDRQVTPAFSENLYNPARYGIPSTLSGYKILAIFTSDDIPCMLPQAKRVLLQTHQSTVHDYLQQSKPLTKILDYLRQLPGETDTVWQLSVVGSAITIDNIKTNTELLQESLKDQPCLQLGGPVDVSEFTVVPQK